MTAKIIHDGQQETVFITKSTSQIQNWTAVAQNTIASSTVFDFSGKTNGLLHIQAALDTETAHTGTKIIVQMSVSPTGNEDWQELTDFIALIGTAATDLIEDNPLAAGSTTIALTGHGYTTEGIWLLIEDGTLANSELIFLKSQSANAIVALDGTTNAHAQNTAMFNVAMVQTITIPQSAGRIRVIIDNTYDADGSTLNYKVTTSTVP